MPEPEEKSVSKWTFLFWIGAIGVALIVLEFVLNWLLPMSS